MPSCKDTRVSMNKRWVNYLTGSRTFRRRMAKDCSCRAYILVLAKGELLEVGSQDELLQKNRRYAELFHCKREGTNNKIYNRKYIEKYISFWVCLFIFTFDE